MSSFKHNYEVSLEIRNCPNQRQPFVFWWSKTVSPNNSEMIVSEIWILVLWEDWPNGLGEPGLMVMVIMSAKNQLNINFSKVSSFFPALWPHQEPFSRSIKSTGDIFGSKALKEIHLLFVTIALWLTQLIISIVHQYI